MLRDRFLGLALLSILAAGSALAAPPPTVVLHGRTVAPDGTPLSGTRAYSVTFHDAETLGSPVGAPLTGDVTLSPEGLFDLVIALPAEVLAESQVWYTLGIDTDVPVDGDASDDVFDQRVQLHSVPFALQAEEVVAVSADRIANGAVDDTEFQRIDGLTGNAQAQFNSNSAAIALKANTADVYTKTEVDASQDAQDTAIALKADAADVYTQSEVDAAQGTQDVAIALKADAADVYTQSEIDTAQGLQDAAIALKANAADVYTQSEIDTAQGLQDTAIALKADAADVYTQSVADTNFVDAAGDSMSGALQLLAGLSTDAIVEQTLNAGVLVDGVTLRDGDIAASTANLTVSGLDAAPASNGNGGDITLTPGAGDGAGSPGAVVLADGAAPPATTANRLYNVGGNLFFNGAQLDAANVGTSVDSSEITNDSIVDADINSAANIAASKLAAGVVVAGEGVAQLTNDAGYVTTVNSAAIANDSIVNEDINASAAIAASKLQSTVMVEGENISLLNNNAGYLTAEADTLALVTGRGATTNTQLTLSGGVKIDTISENTAANGVSIDSVLLKDGFVQLPSGAAPSPTTNRLYNEGGTIKFNGTALGGGGSSAPEVWTVSTGLVVLPEYVASSAHHGANVLANNTYPKYVQFFNHPTTKVVDEIKLKAIRYTAYDPSITMNVFFEIRDVLTGTVNHTVSTAATNLVTVTNAAWITVAIDASLANRTITDSEFLGVRIEKIGANTTGALDLHFAVTVSDGA